MGSPPQHRQKPALALGNIMRGPHLKGLVRLGNAPIVIIAPLKFFRVSPPKGGQDARVVTR